MTIPMNWTLKMRTMDRIKAIWQHLENQQSLIKASGLRKTRYFEDATAEIYLGLRSFDSVQERCLLLKVRTTELKNFRYERKLKGLKLDKISDEQEGFAFLNLILLNPHAQEIFDVLIEDIVRNISSEVNQRQILKSLIDRIEAWRMLFDETVSENLSTEEQQGLYGELYFLRKLIIQGQQGKKFCVTTWLGSDKELRDFQSRDCAVEVKTTRGNNHQKILINSERQLDASRLSNLWLFHISLEVQRQNGETLNAMVDSLIEILKVDTAALSEFKAKLIRARYFAAHRNTYEDYGYQQRKETFYKVEGKFPRIEESIVPSGVGDVRYSIILSDYSEYIVNETLVFENIRYGISD